MVLLVASRGWLHSFAPPGLRRRNACVIPSALLRHDGLGVRPYTGLLNICINFGAIEGC
jgi:hypothetical protein